ncbi:hypothetical protein ACIPF8_23655 [Collimonas sp. NPDC087041]|uniref:hypothetical protein n=1 Tax=Collimonas sp. NPDC087041 TaxID=3363960 RepID=UPI0037FBC0D9
MRLEVEKKRPVENASEAQVRSAILALRSYGPSSFTSLTDVRGNYLQVAGGGVTCMVEHRDVFKNRHYRGYHNTPSKVYPDGTILVFGGGEIQLLADEWFMAPMVLDAFLAVFNGRELPASIAWRDKTETLTSS